MASLHKEQEQPSSSRDVIERETSGAEHKSEVETATSGDACKKEAGITDHPLVCYQITISAINVDAISVYADTALDVWHQFYYSSA